MASVDFSSLGPPTVNANDHLAMNGSYLGQFLLCAEDHYGRLAWTVYKGATAAPGTNATFASTSDPIYNDNDTVAFEGTLNLTSGVTSSTSTGIWTTDAINLAIMQVARQGSQAPGCPAGATFASFSQLVLPNQNGVVFLGTLNVSSTAGVTSNNNTGIWAVDNNGTLQLIVRTGDILNGKTVTALQFLPSPAYVSGTSRSFSAATGDLVYLATFSDKSTAIFNVVFP
jgi:hypothetical protein